MQSELTAFMDCAVQLILGFSFGLPLRLLRILWFADQIRMLVGLSQASEFGSVRLSILKSQIKKTEGFRSGIL